MEYYNQLILEGIINRRMLREAGEGGKLGLDSSLVGGTKPNSSQAGFNPGGDTSTVIGGIAGLGFDPSPKMASYGRELDQMYYQRPVQYSRSDYMRAYQAYLEAEEAEKRRRRMGR